MQEVAIDNRLFDWPCEAPALRGVRCTDCDEVTFPVQTSCQRCGSTGVETIDLPTTGTLWTWTSQSFKPKEPYKGLEDPENFAPYYVGYVELEGFTRVETRLAVADESALKIGMKMALKIEPFIQDEAGNQVMIPVFAPAQSE